MKSPRTLLCLIAPLVLLLSMTVAATAGDNGERPLTPIGLSGGQTIRVVALNMAPNRLAKLSVKFLDSDGKVLHTSDVLSVGAGQMGFFDLPRSSIDATAARIQLRPVAVLADRNSMGILHVTVEIFNDDDGKTTVLWSGPPGI